LVTLEETGSSPSETPGTLGCHQGPHSARPSVRRRWIILGVVVVALLIAAWIGSGVLRPHKKARTAPTAVAVGVAKVTAGDIHVDLSGIGTVTPTATITVQTQINGQLTSVGYTEGQMVRKGQFLAQIDPRPYQAALAMAQGALAHDSGVLAQAKSDLARYETLGREDSIAQQQVADQEYLVQQDEGTVAEDRANIQTAKLNLVYCHIDSPVSGRAGLRLVDPGNYVQTASATGLVVLTELQPITVIFVLPEDDIPALGQQMHNGGKLAVSAYDRTNDKLIAQGVLTTMDNTVDTTTGTVKLRAAFQNENLALFPNEFVNARLQLQTLKHMTQVPVRAVQYGAPGSFVYLVRPDSTVGVRVIKTGVTDGDNVQVLSGLSPGDTVVVDGVSLLRDGARIRVSQVRGGGREQTNDGPGAPPGRQPQNVPAARRVGGSGPSVS